jgi:hypothetical protein
MIWYSIIFQEAPVFRSFKTTLLGLLLAGASGLLVACGGGTQEVQSDVKNVPSSGSEATGSGEPQTAANGAPSAEPSQEATQGQDQVSEQEPTPEQEPVPAVDPGRVWIDELAGDPLVSSHVVQSDIHWASGNPGSIATPNPAIRQHLLIRDEVSWQALLSDTAVNLVFPTGGLTPTVNFNTHQVVVLGLGHRGLPVLTNTLRSGGVLQVLVRDSSDMAPSVRPWVPAELMLLVLPQSEEVRVTRQSFPAGLIPLAVQTDIPLLSPAEELTPVGFGGATTGLPSLHPFDAYLIPDMATWQAYLQVAPDFIELGDELPTIDFSTHQILVMHGENTGGCMSNGRTVLRSGNVVQVTEWRRAGPPDCGGITLMRYYDVFLVIPRTDTVQLNRLSVYLPWDAPEPNL